MGLPHAVIPATEVQTLRSAATDTDYQISVALPYHYDEHPDRTWPVIYVLDANLYFGLVVDMVRAMNIRVEFCNELPDAFIVGIGYPVRGSLSTILHTAMHNRMRDFLPQTDTDAETFIQTHFPLENPQRAGQAAAFWTFLHQELIPVIDMQYRTDRSDRTLLGHSWGGTFAWYTLFRDPEIFHRYVIVSSAANIDDEAAYAQHHDDLPVRLHVVMEQADAEAADVEKFLALLTKRRYGGLNLTSQLIDCTHCAIVPSAFQSGLVAVLSHAV